MARVVIDREHKIARVDGLTVLAAGWLGHYFTRNHPALSDTGWHLYYYGKGDPLFHLGTCGDGKPRDLVHGSLSVERMANEIAGLIRADPPKPRRHTHTITHSHTDADGHCCREGAG